jgi:hypothetical protein
MDQFRTDADRHRAQIDAVKRYLENHEFSEIKEPAIPGTESYALRMKFKGQPKTLNLHFIWLSDHPEDIETELDSKQIAITLQRQDVDGLSILHLGRVARDGA